MTRQALPEQFLPDEKYFQHLSPKNRRAFRSAVFSGADSVNRLLTPCRVLTTSCFRLDADSRMQQET